MYNGVLSCSYTYACMRVCMSEWACIHVYRYAKTAAIPVSSLNQPYSRSQVRTLAPHQFHLDMHG